MSSGIDEMVSAIAGSVGLEYGDTEEDLQLDPEYAMSCAADAITRLVERINELEKRAKK